MLDEVQRSEPLLLAIKEAVDKDTSPGQFLLTGSANILTAPRFHDALTGRTEIVRLWPLSQSEIERSSTNLVDRLFAGSALSITGAVVGRDAFVGRAVRGGYPEAYGRSQRRRDRWFESYVESVVVRDIRDLADVRKIEAIPSLLRLIAAQASNLFKAETMSNDLGISTKTVQSYRAITKLRDARGDQFVAGAVIYTGYETKALTEKIWAVPVSALWGADDPLVTKILSPSPRWRCTIDAALLDDVDEGSRSRTSYWTRSKPKRQHLPLKRSAFAGFLDAPERIRTSDPRIRNPPLCLRKRRLSRLDKPNSDTGLRICYLKIGCFLVGI